MEIIQKCASSYQQWCWVVNDEFIHAILREAIFESLHWHAMKVSGMELLDCCCGQLARRKCGRSSLISCAETWRCRARISSDGLLCNNQMLAEAMVGTTCLKRLELVKWADTPFQDDQVCTVLVEALKKNRSPGEMKLKVRGFGNEGSLPKLLGTFQNSARVLKGTFSKATFWSGLIGKCQYFKQWLGRSVHANIFDHFEKNWQRRYPEKVETSWR